MLPTDYQAAVAAFLRDKNVTRCPTVCVLPTQATVSEADRAAYRDYVAAREAERVQRIKSFHQAARPWPSSPI